jgi:hypothetical protein
MNLPPALLTGLLLILAAAPNWAATDTVYKCGNNYSQQACPGGKALNIDDSRLPEQKAQHDAVNRRDAELARDMEKTRLANEATMRAAAKQKHSAKPQAAAKPRRHQSLTEEPGQLSPKRTKQAGRKVQDFIAVVPGSKPKPAKAKKTSSSEAQ